MQKDSILRKNLSRGGFGFQEVLSVFSSQHLVTFWKSTTTERNLYAKNSK